MLEIDHTALKIKLASKDIFSKCDQILNFPRIWSYFMKKSLMENFIFCAVSIMIADPKWIE